MIIELISIGTELLLGDILNTNVQYLARECANLGFLLYHTGVVGDNRIRMKEELQRALDRSDIVLITGGLGTTGDDITKSVVSDLVGRPLFEDKEAKENYLTWFKNRDLELKEMDVSFPEGSTPLKNAIGIAFGAWIPYKDKYLAILPGPPREMSWMFEHELKPILKKFSMESIQSVQAKIACLGEYDVALRISDEIDHSINPSYAPYAKEDGALVRITAKDKTEDLAKESLEVGKKVLLDAFGDLVLSFEDKSREEVLYDLLVERKEKVVTGESITGGMLSSRLINVAGSSEIIKESYIVYSDEAKHRLLGVTEALLQKYTAVSREVCQAMLFGLRERTGSELCIATTGYAGPDGENVGLVYLGILYHDKMEIEEFHFQGGRNHIRQRTCNQAIDRAILRMRKEK